MDKYAVDLDQVLNDFEYSELTDQYNTASRNVPAPGPAQTVTKHSINNVFHSLNEYLNTGITNVNGVNPVDNNSLKNVNVLKNKSIKSNNLKTEEILDDFKASNSAELSGKELSELDNPTKTIGQIEEYEEDKEKTDLLKKKDLIIEDNVVTEEVIAKVESAIDKENVLECVHNEVLEESDLNLVGNLIDYTENIEKVIENTEESTVESVEDVVNVVTEDVKKIGFEEDIDLDDSEINQLLENLDLELEDEVIVKENSKEFVLEKKVEENVDIEEYAKLNQVVLFENQQEKERITNKSQLVDNKLEINKETLEVESEERFQENVPDISNLTSHEKNEVIKENKDILVNKETLVNDKNENKEFKEENEPVKNVKDLNEDLNITKNNGRVKENIKESNEETINKEPFFEAAKTKENEVSGDIREVDEGNLEYVNNVEKPLTEEPKGIESVKEHVIECIEVEKPKKKSKMKVKCSDKIKTEPTSQLSEKLEKDLKITQKEAVRENNSGSKEHFKNPQKSLEEDIENIVKVDVQVNNEEVENQDEISIKPPSEPLKKETSQESLTRPQNLPLNGKGDVQQSQLKREINLIGDPGSTPYNNVYINKEIPRSEINDSGNEYSVSSSPTFSDISSGSTASTEEIRDEPEDIPKDKSPKNLKEASKTDNASSTSSGFEVKTSGEKNETEFSKTKSTEEADESSEDGTATNVPVADVVNLGEVNVNQISMGKMWLGREAPLWIPDSDAMSCLHCDMKFTVLKRRHHCRACGLVLCAKCCHLRFRLEYLEAEARVCNKCHDILNKDGSSSESDLSPDTGNSPSYRPNPNNPLEYCSTVSPLQQVGANNPNPLPAVMVPVGVLKRKGSNRTKSNKSVMFCDGIRPGSDLTNLDTDFNYSDLKLKKTETKSDKKTPSQTKINKDLPLVDPETKTFVPNAVNSLPPMITVNKTDIFYSDVTNGPNIVEQLKIEQLTFAILVSLQVHVKIINMSCCINKTAWCFSTEGLINVGQDEIVILLEFVEEEAFVPKDVFLHIIAVYNEAVKGSSVKEMGISLHTASNFLDSKNHAGFVYIKPTFQCLENVIKPKEPYLIGILIHRWETPWAKLFPLRLILRLGAEYRYYPSPIISTRHRDSVFVEVGHTIINLLADFRNFSFTLPQIRGLTVHMEDKKTTVTIPVNRYDQVIKSMNDSSEHILAFAGNFSLIADSHLVCIQDTQGNENCYSTHAINIHNKPRKITGASFIVFNGALKSSSGLTAKSNIVEDGMMIQVLPEHMQHIRDSLRAMKNHVINCGCVNAATDETVNIVWGENDLSFNIGVMSAIDETPLNGIPSIRVHNAKNHVCQYGSRTIRWTEVFIIQNGDDNPKNQDPLDISRLSESIAKATCDALVKYLDLLVTNNCQKIGIRTTLHVDDVSYLAGSNGTKLAPIYMKSLDNELIPVLHRITSNNFGSNMVVLELIFRILNV